MKTYNRTYDPKRLATWTALYESGWSAGDIARKYHYLPTSVCGYLRAHGIQTRPRGGDRRSKAFQQAREARE